MQAMSDDVVKAKDLTSGETVEMTRAEAEQKVAQGNAEAELPRKPTTFGATIPPVDNRPDLDEFDLSNVVVERGINDAPTAAIVAASENAAMPPARGRTAGGGKGKAPTKTGPVLTDEDAERARNAPNVPGT
jgi:hypothetical protein